MSKMGVGGGNARITEKHFAYFYVYIASLPKMSCRSINLHGPFCNLLNKNIGKTGFLLTLWSKETSYKARWILNQCFIPEKC